MTGSITAELPIPSDSGAPVCAGFVQAARIELYACMQLLAERARFITSAAWVAIALGEGKQFVYCASVGSLAPEIGTDAADARELRDCVQNGKSVFRNENLLAVAIIRDMKTRGFFQLASESGGFRDQDLQSVTRLAEMVNTAIDHAEAAERSQQVISSGVEHSPKPDIPSLWHAPDSDSDSSDSNPDCASQAQGASRQDVAAGVHACGSCGFPVSRKRSICVDCEERAGTTHPVIPTDLFAAEKQESWLTTHGYTIASLLVTALAAAVIYWLR